MVVGRNNGVVGLTGFSDKKMSGLLFGPQKSGRNNGVVVWRGSTVLGNSRQTSRMKVIKYLYKRLNKVVYYMLSFLHNQYRNDYSCIAYN